MELAVAVGRLLEAVRAGEIRVTTGPEQRLLQRIELAAAAHGAGWRVLRGEGAAAAARRNHPSADNAAARTEEVSA